MHNIEDEEKPRVKLVRYETQGEVRSGVLVRNWVHDIELDEQGLPLSAGTRRAEREQVRLLAPVTPSKVLCVGRNYAAHIAEMNRETPRWPFFFLKGPNSVVGPHSPVLRPEGVEQFHYEAELGVVIGRTAKRVSRDGWSSFVLGYVNANDLTARDWQNSDGQWGRAKGSDTFCPLGPWVETDVADPENLAIRSWVNGEIRQDGRTDDLVFGIGELLEFITTSITLVPGDVVLTGTPGGVGNLQVGDEVEVEVEGLGRLSNRVEAAE